MAEEGLCGSRYALQVRVPISFTAAIKTAADRELMTISEYVRQTLIERLRRDGVDPVAPQGDRSSDQHTSAAALSFPIG